jgi:hypothetical protein
MYPLQCLSHKDLKNKKSKNFILKKTFKPTEKLQEKYNSIYLSLRFTNLKFCHIYLLSVYIILIINFFK